MPRTRRSGFAPMALLAVSATACLLASPVLAQVPVCPAGYGFANGVCVPVAYQAPVYVQQAPEPPIYDALTLAFGVGGHHDHDRHRGHGPVRHDHDHDRR